MSRFRARAAFALLVTSILFGSTMRLAHALALLPQADQVERRGVVHAVLKTSDGGALIGGTFRLVNGQPRSNIAKLNADGSLDSNWSSDVEGTINALAETDDAYVIAGYFWSVSGKDRELLAAIDKQTGIATAWHPLVTGYVNTLAAHGNVVYIAGTFQHIDGVLRDYSNAAVNVKTGEVLPWEMRADASINAMIATDSTVLVGGQFAYLDGAPRTNLVALDPNTGTASAWAPQLDGPVRAMALRGSTLWIAGGFDSVNGTARSKVAALDLSTGLPTDWTPPALDFPVSSIDVDATRVFLAGRFTTVGNKSRNGTAALRINGAALTQWNPDFEQDVPDGSNVAALASFGDRVIVGGGFGASSGVQHRGLATVDAKTGMPLDVVGDVAFGGEVNDIALSEDGGFIVGGEFSYVGGVPRANLARFNSDGTLDRNWRADVSGAYVRHVLVHRGHVYISGQFWAVNDTPVGPYFAEIDASTGALLPSFLDGAPSSWAALDNRLYLGGVMYVNGDLHQGLFAVNLDTHTVAPDWSPTVWGGATTMMAGDGVLYLGGQSIHTDRGVTSLVALDAGTGALAPFDATVVGTVRTMTLSSDALYISGQIETVNGQSRDGLAKLDRATGALAAWNPTLSVGSFTSALGVSGKSVVVGGSFYAAPAQNLALLSDVTGLIQPASPRPDYWVNTISVHEGTVSIGGAFQHMSGVTRLGIARFLDDMIFEDGNEGAGQ